MLLGFDKWLLNFLMSGWFFEDKKNKQIKNNTTTQDKGGNIHETKMDYVSKVTGFLEAGVREMQKDLKKTIK